MSTTLRRVSVVLLVVLLAAASVAGFEASRAVALPSAPTVAVGALSSDAGSPVQTWTQTAALTIVDVTDFGLALGETLDIVQDPGAVLVIRVTGTEPSLLNGI